MGKSTYLPQLRRSWGAERYAIIYRVYIAAGSPTMTRWSEIVAVRNRRVRRPGPLNRAARVAARLSSHEHIRDERDDQDQPHLIFRFGNSGAPRSWGEQLARQNAVMFEAASGVTDG